MSLVCPTCGAAHAEDERFCRSCDVPLVAEGGPSEEVVDDRARRVRMVKPQLSEGDLVRVAIGRQQPEAELIQDLLLQEGVPSTLRRTQGFDVPEMLAAGPRDVLVPQSGVATAREVLLDAELLAVPDGRQVVEPGRILLWLLGAVAIVGVFAIVIDLITQ